jgi:cyclopropane fatty-acyl-phospholipid synthase-like methyltransferase
MRALVHDFLRGPIRSEKFDAAYAVDVIEHISRSHENRFMRNIVKSLNRHGICILGSPSTQSQTYASKPSRAGHVNCKDAAEMRELMSAFFHNVFMFSMNDEVVHTGFSPMAHYLWAIGSDRRP